ncbi:hypothetical protein [Vibrio coralliilyticus]|uniref:hypothetical protein n=1 Tax=Vibrio coralliilyticus TaxID=190893 RepID=UPI001560838A|nr:hypothetical protein [Vibrio coralliilyticus]NRF31101.1 hypothetical protein [Vibrio coralliilyticus]NRF50930.1 hypothetical protein [Vibrio coralliilyticus]NRG05789.1 hypothetical protein [Vibrio coralliilyticus]
MKEVALITLHGMGKVKPDYYDELEKELKKELGSEWTKVSFQNVQYAPILQQPEDELWQAMMSEPSNDLDATRLRQFFLYGFGDAGSLEHSSHRRKDKYLAVQKEIFKTLEHAYLDIGGNQNRPVIIIAQSLGCQVISNYLWDAEHGLNIFENYVDDENKKLFMKLKTCENLITTGCNIPLFNAGLQERKCFPRPHPSFRWDNYYDPDDVLGWPLRQLDDSYNLIVRDHPINAGGLIASWNPFSHGQYWGDKDVIKPLASIIRSKLS